MGAPSTGGWNAGWARTSDVSAPQSPVPAAEQGARFAGGTGTVACFHSVDAAVACDRRIFPGSLKAQNLGKKKNDPSSGPSITIIAIPGCTLESFKDQCSPLRMIAHKLSCSTAPALRPWRHPSVPSSAPPDTPAVGRLASQLFLQTLARLCALPPSPEGKVLVPPCKSN